MKERPILFSGEMVRAILAGKKTQTRRIVKPKGVSNDVARWLHHMAKGVQMKCPYGIAGDQLWVKETWRIGAWREDGRMAIDYKATPELTHTPWVTIPDDNGEKFDEYYIKLSDECERKGIVAEDDGYYHWEPGKAPLSWRSSRFMPRWASRVLLDVVNVRTARVQDISEEDAFAEGIEAPRTGISDWGEPAEAIYEYKRLWDYLNFKRGFGWDTNPWVWVIEFRELK